MRVVLFCLLAISASCSHQSSWPKDTKPLAVMREQPVIAATAIPASVQAYIALYFPGWTIPAATDYATGFWSFYDRSVVPYFTTVDINDDQVADYGVLIKKQAAVQLVILLGTGDSFSHVVINDLKKSLPDSSEGLQHCLLPEPPGQIDVAWPAIKSLILPSNGINLLHLENRVCVYYWDGKGVAVFETM